MPEPMTIALALQGVNMLGNLGASYLDRNQQKKAQRELDRRVARANLSRAFGGNPQVAPVEVESTGGAKFLRGIGQAAGIGSQAFSLYGGLQNQAALNRLRDLQIANAEMARDKNLATTAAQAAPLPEDPATFGAALQMLPQGDPRLLQTLGRQPQAPDGMSEYGQNVFDATYGQRVADQKLFDLQMEKAQADINKINAATDAAGSPTLSGSNRIRIAADAGSNVATLNPFLRGDEARRLIVEQSGIKSPELLTSAVAGYNEQAAKIRSTFNTILDGAVKQATETNYESGVLALEAGLQAQGYDLSENMLNSFLDRIDAASDAYNFSATEKNKLMQLTTIRANALRAIDTLADPGAIGQIQEAFGRSEGAIKKGYAYFMGEQEAIGPEAANFLTQLGFLRDTVARYRSGAALTEAEQDFYEGLVGGIFTQPEQLRNTLGELVNQMNREITSLYEVEAISRGKGPY
tara:strand:+ start:28238 stop:29632 length:1395 start_codon:yes stop_codon:yes gene_type:complete